MMGKLKRTETRTGWKDHDGKTEIVINEMERYYWRQNEKKQ